MKYKKKLKSNKKIKGGSAITREDDKKIYGLYILANIYLKYCIQFRIWCINFFSNTSISTDIETDTSISQFIDKYYTNFEDIYNTTIAGYQYKAVININNEGFNKEIFVQAILEIYRRLFYRHTKYSGTDFKPYINQMYINSKLKLFKEINIIVSCDNEDLKKKLYELYALYIIALSNNELHQEFSLIHNKMYKLLYYNNSQINEIFIGNCIDFYNKMLYQFLFFNILNSAKTSHFTDSDDIKNNIIIIKNTIYDIIKDLTIRTVLKNSRNATLSIFFQIYDINIDEEITLFANLGIDEIIKLLNDSDVATSESFNRNLSFTYLYRLFLILDKFIKGGDILLQFTELEKPL